MTKTKKSVCKLFITMILILSLVTACTKDSRQTNSDGDKNPKGETNQESGSEDGMKPIKFTWVNFGLDSNNGLSDSNGDMSRWIENKFGLDITFEHVAETNIWDQLTLWAAGGSYPEVFTGTARAGVLNTGAGVKWANLTPYFKDASNYPNLTNIQEHHSRSLSALKTRDQEEHIIGFPIGMNYNPGEPNPDENYMWGWWMRDDILQAVGGQRPTTIDEFTDMLRKVKDLGLKQENGQPVYPLLMPPTDWQSQSAFFMVWGLNWAGLAKDGYYQFWGYTTQGYESMKYLNQLYNEGLIDPEWVTQKDEMYQEKIRNGAGAVIPGYNDYRIIEEMKEAGKDYTYTVIPIPKVPGISRPFPLNGLSSPDPTSAMYVTSKASPELCQRLANLCEWFQTEEGARCLELGASPDMLELKTSGAYEGKYWYKDAFQELDYVTHGDTTAARIRHGVIPLYTFGPQGTNYTNDVLKIPSISNNDASIWAKENHEWISANNNISYMGDFGPENFSDDMNAINNQIWSIAPPIIFRALILPPDQFEDTYKQLIKELEEMGAKELNAYRYQQSKTFMDANNNGDVPEDYPYADLFEEVKP
ncbi:hypothetical protein HZI73_18525 [Vallitalea pronyensis]|uniref:Uncharacterized protein n=1 Tax=Vallitalea pronyensis TaxID=1348613 RepID=A0A8J8SI76_9FIRM|nr:extracellular solute-binding protein [Vallitalea pronyensis]QUI24164.1 hypothetical protein HZI73_18525 [Vallitalea pronyensis]